jgi:hypothetical protein
MDAIHAVRSISEADELLEAVSQFGGASVLIEPMGQRDGYFRVFVKRSDGEGWSWEVAEGSEDNPGRRSHNIVEVDRVPWSFHECAMVSCAFLRGEPWRGLVLARRRAEMPSWREARSRIHLVRDDEEEDWMVD